RSFARYLLNLLGFILWSSAAALAFGGVFVILTYKNYRYLFQESFLSLPGWLAVVAALIMLPTGVLAISISVKSSRYQQGALMYLLLVIFCLQMSSAVLAQFYSIHTTSELKRSLGYLVYHYNGTQGPGSMAVDTVQRKLQCCGVQNYRDWLNTTVASWHLSAEKAHVPESCCKEKYSPCRGDVRHLDNLFQEGCLRKLEVQLHFVMFYVFWCCILLSVLELLVAVSNGILMRNQPFCDFQIL
ncbi:TSN3 protein, partial [Atlantisia rogersi]|nr:TSN3 protein [Atlantisia rogersi]